MKHIKKWYLVLVLLAFFGSFAYGSDENHEEIDYLLFLPDSGNQFVNEAKAMIQLDNAAKYLMDRNPAPGQICVYGYAAAFANNTDPADLSRDRALFVIRELQKRGLSKGLFADPVGSSSVDLWGSNANESGRRGNRRVRILLNGAVLTPAVVEVCDFATETPAAVQEKPIQKENISEKSRTSFPWWILLLVLIGLAILLFKLKRRKKPVPPGTTAAPSWPWPESIAIVPPAAAERVKVLEEEEIRRYAYGLYTNRYGQNSNMTEDWYRSIYELTIYYEAQGYRVLLYWEV